MSEVNKAKITDTIQVMLNDEDTAQTKGPDPDQWPVEDRRKEPKAKAIKGTKGPDPEQWDPNRPTYE